MATIASAIVDGDGTARYAHRITTGHGHALSADEPADLGGGNSGPAPYELLLAGLGACTAITLRMYAEKKGWELGAVHVELAFVKTKDAGDHVERTVRIGGALSDEQRRRLAEIAEKTPVTLTLKQGVRIDTRFA